ncbi:MAG: hypothetical protein LBM66_01290, partial [Bifidobacteriaceae bacterium]|nr:hypothetical protein [Bifidobacteriaceae bacterium]
LPESVQVVSLSATVSNAEEFGEWLRAVRGEVSVVVSEHRPVPLWQHVLTNKGLLDLYVATQETAPGITHDGAARGDGDRTASDAEPATPKLNPELASLRAAARRPGGYHRRRSGGRGSGPLRPPPRFAVIDALDREGLLPAIFFVFSRAGCEAAVEQCRNVGLRLTTAEERGRIRDIVEAGVAGVPAADLDVLGYGAFLDAAENGYAAHHAGLLPVFKQIVEVAFQAGLIKAVFATETLALGINMPARTVVLDRLDKWNGSEHAPLTAGEYTQLTGRAGRRGIDVEGHAVVAAHRGFDPEVLASLASKRTYPLRSAFHPTYNMAMNLIGRVGRERARSVLELSFAQFQADRAVVGLAKDLHGYDAAIAGYTKAMACSRGDYGEYDALRRRVSGLEKAASREKAAARTEAAARLAAGLRRGDIVRLRHGRYRGEALVLEADASPLCLIAPRGQVRRVPAADLLQGLVVLGRIGLPKRFNPRDVKTKRDTVARMRAAVGRGAGRRGPTPGGPEPHFVDRKESDAGRPGRPGGAAGGGVAAELEEARTRLKAHPCHTCPDRETHARWAARLHRALHDQSVLAGRIEQRTRSIARDFDKVCDVLDRLGYIERDEEVDGGWVPTPAGRLLARVYAERDIVIAEALRTGAWNGLGPAELAGVVASTIYASRTDEGQAAPRPPRRLAAAIDATVRAAGRIEDLEHEVGLPATPSPEAAASGALTAWASGAGLGVVLADEVLSPGDFVRLAGQVVDVLGQVAAVAPSPELMAAASAAQKAVRRGVVAAA